MSDRILYQDDIIRVEIWPQEENGHYLFVGENRYGLQRGVLEDLTSRPLSGLGSGLNAVDDMILQDVHRRTKLSPAIYVGYALSQARIKELENYQRSLRKELIGLEDEDVQERMRMSESERSRIIYQELERPLTQ